MGMRTPCNISNEWGEKRVKGISIIAVLKDYFVLDKKENIIKEYYLLCYGYLKYQGFVDKYQFTHMLIEKYEYIYRCFKR